MTQAKTPGDDARLRPGEVLLRTATALVGGYAVAWLTAQAGSLLLFRSGMTTKADAVLIATNLGLLLTPAVIVFAFATRRPVGFAATTGGAAVLSVILARTA